METAFNPLSPRRPSNLEKSMSPCTREPFTQCQQKVSGREEHAASPSESSLQKKSVITKNLL